MQTRIQGFDVARAFAILGMYFVNFNMVFGDHSNQSHLAWFLSLFNGNASSLFVILAGMGTSLLSSKSTDLISQKRIRLLILKRSSFLLVAGLVLNLWWPADILHFYAFYMAIGSLFLFAKDRTLLLLAIVFVIGFHVLYLLIPYDTAWNWAEFRYEDLYTLNGWIRNTFYNGWNPVFPWAGFFFLGMWLGRQDWSKKSFLKKLAIWAACIYLLVILAQSLIPLFSIQNGFVEFVLADYLPPFLPFFLGTSSLACLSLSACMWLAARLEGSPVLSLLQNTGKMTFSHYISHTTLGMLLFAILSDTSFGENQFPIEPLPPSYILMFSLLYFSFSVAFSYWWQKKFGHGPLEMLMRKFSR